MKPSEFCCALGIALSLMCAAAASAFETDTHVVLSERAVGAAGGLTAFLNADSGEFPKGLDQLVDGWVLRDLVADGSISEDDFPRYFRHFHDPTKDWSPQ